MAVARSRRSFATPSLLAAAFLLAACDTTAPELPPPSITGEWAGVLNGGGFANFWDFSLTLAETPSGKITGTGVLAPVVPQQGVRRLEFEVRWGAYGFPDVLVALMTPEFVDVNFSGEVLDPDRIQGLVNGSAFNNVAVTLLRQDAEP